MNEIQTEILKMMKYIHETCISNNITYYMIGGTMLGAVRHQGFIPWDDDIDIAIPREDFNKFIDVVKSNPPKWSEIRCPEQNEFINFGFVKFMNTNTTIVEGDEKSERVGGVFIDIFPLDGLGNNKKKALSRLKRARFKYFLLKTSQDLAPLNQFLKRILSRYAKIVGRKKLYDDLLKYISKYSFYNSDYVANVVGAWALKEFMNREWFGNPTLYRFEGQEFFGVENADKYLKSMYGDYMKLPPIEKRNSHHNVKYLNLNLSYKEYLLSNKEN